MNLNLKQLRAFSAVARSASFTRAAVRLHLTQPALTVQVRDLESALGVRLFDRNTRQVKLTAIGRDLLPTLERVLADLDAVAEDTRQLAAGHRGRVRVAALPSICATRLPRAIAQLAKTHPAIRVELRDTVAQRIIALVAAEEVDFGIGSFEGLGREFELLPYTTDRLAAVFRKGHALDKRATLKLEDLAEWPLIFMDTQSSVRAHVERTFSARGIAKPPAFEVTYMATAVGLVRAGLGVSLLPTSALELELATGLRVHPLRDAALRRNISIVRRAGRTFSPAAQRLLEALRAEARPAR
ncbi:LysR family transcriptional regulator [Usitatibacter palustris]|uniref:HTH-type transcriptional activator CmpR n=1 Tax=Usitatibacter palustris TaxID=2732487 RepID=A0A6M4H2Y5_9PROT|nr:LysR family transcriptional regulator [Usitatibacter palustris]QJR13438.1 HTH-type transcriptional activator CmpR [Usitatibacter palustris]